jgi:hypothetical protein
MAVRTERVSASRPRSASAAPVRKVAAGAIGGAITTIVVWVIRLIAPQVVIPAEVAAALTTLIVFAVSYFTPPGAGEVIE